MLVEQIKQGQELWFVQHRSENGRSMYSIGSGIVQEVRKGKHALSFDHVILEGTGDTPGTHDIYGTDCYPDRESAEYQRNLEQRSDDFVYNLIDPCEKFMNKVIDIGLGVAKGAAASSIKSVLPGQEQFIEDMKMKGQLMASTLAAKFRDTVRGMTDSFLKKSQDDVMAHMDDKTRQIVFHTDLSQYEPAGCFTLDEKDIAGISMDNGTEPRLEESDLAFAGEGGISL